ncbi:MAG TPA: hypothetical protein DCK76_03540 [Desulfotomaculum sp.]|nr:hypothetical protein [Desulfotomaculum sp.]HBY04777.1 hypothetical protein [Desulfotomaculum sp.]
MFSIRNMVRVALFLFGTTFLRLTPAFVLKVVAVVFHRLLNCLALRKEGLGLLLSPAMFVLGFTMIFSLAIAELVKPLYDLNITAEGLIPPHENGRLCRTTHC